MLPPGRVTGARYGNLEFALANSFFGNCYRGVALAAGLLLFAGCGGGSSGGGGGGNTGGTQNGEPTANAGTDVNVAESSAVTLSGSGSDPDAGDTLSYSWEQVGGPPVTIMNANQAEASFSAPAIAAGPPPGQTVTVAGSVSYEFVPPGVDPDTMFPCAGLDFENVIVKPIRGATVQLIDFTTNVETLTFRLTVSDGRTQATDTVAVTVGGVFASTAASDTGDYAFPGAAANATLRLRVRAEVKQQGIPGWDVEVRNNVDTSAAPPPLSSRPLYVLEGSDFATGTGNANRNLTATTGWGETSYVEPRAAAPFAILDSIYSAIQFIAATDPTAVFPPLDVFWSVDNTTDQALNTDIDAGILNASFYLNGLDSLFLLGDANVDTEEFDDHVIVHEWGHYFEDNFSRSDSTGGPHAIGQRLDPRLAFGEGWATAFAAMSLDEQLYCDTSVPGTSGGFGIGAETGSYNPQGWYDEISVLRFIYDLFDGTSVTEPGDTGSIGFARIYDAMVGPQAFSEAFTTVFSFATELRSSLPTVSDQLFLDAQYGRHNQNQTPAPFDIWGTNETNDAGDAAAVLPIYTDLEPDGTPLQICVDSSVANQIDDDRDGNKLAEYRYLRVSIANPARYRIEVNTVNPPSTPPAGYDCTTAPDDDPNIHMHSDPDISMLRNGAPVIPFPQGLSCEPNQEIAETVALSPGTYVLDITEFRFADTESPTDFPSANTTQMCFDVTMQAI